MYLYFIKFVTGAVSTTPVVHLELAIFPQIFDQIRNGPNGLLSGLGETDS
jgi:hypothetical protein